MVGERGQNSSLNLLRDLGICLVEMPKAIQFNAGNIEILSPNFPPPFHQKVTTYHRAGQVLSGDPWGKGEPTPKNKTQALK